MLLPLLLLLLGCLVFHLRSIYFLKELVNAAVVMVISAENTTHRRR